MQAYFYDGVTVSSHSPKSLKSKWKPIRAGLVMKIDSDSVMNGSNGGKILVNR